VRQQFVQLGERMIGDAREHIAEPAERLALAWQYSHTPPRRRLQQFLDQLAKDYCHDTVHLTHTYLRAIFRLAVDEGWLSKNPARILTIAKITRDRDKTILTLESVQLFKDELNGSDRIIVAASVSLRSAGRGGAWIPLAGSDTRSRTPHPANLRAWKSVPELKPDHRAVLQPRQFVKQITDLPLQLEFLGVGELQRIVLATQASDTYDLEILIDYRLARSDGHILNATELMHTHLLHQRTLSRAQVLSPSGRSERCGCL
jgi:hypothetical protein